MRNLVSLNDVFNLKALEKSFETMLDSWNSEFHSSSNKDGSFSIDIEVPGMRNEDLKIEVLNGYVNVTGERKTDKTTRTVNKSYMIPNLYDRDSVTAALADGILTLSFKSKEVLKTPLEGKRIPITGK